MFVWLIHLIIKVLIWILQPHYDVIFHLNLNWLTLVALYNFKLNSFHSKMCCYAKTNENFRFESIQIITPSGRKSWVWNFIRWANHIVISEEKNTEKENTKAS